MKGWYQLGFLLILVFCSLGQIRAQSPENPLKGNLQEQFDYLVNKSSRYQKNRVVPEIWLNSFWANIQDTLLGQRELLQKNLETIENQEKKISQLQTGQVALEQDIETLKQEKNTLSFLGIPLTKSVYHIFVWTIIGGLAAGLFFFLARFRYANVTTRKMRSENKELQEKADHLRKRMLEKEQELRRQLQDEINKRLR